MWFLNFTFFKVLAYCGIGSVHVSPQCSCILQNRRYIHIVFTTKYDFANIAQCAKMNMGEQMLCYVSLLVYSALHAGFNSNWNMQKTSVLGLSEVQNERGSVVIWEKFKRCYEKVWEKLKLWKVWHILKQILTQVPFWTREAFSKQN